jgi:hypothetical protein
MKSFSLFLAFLLLLIFTIFYTSCQKEYSYEGGPTTGTGGTAVYTLEGNGGNCTGPIINGTYTTGTALLPSNNIQLRVNVTTIGSYTLTTPEVNGIQFSTSGNFTATGAQTITLSGSGNPLAAGTFFFTPSVGPGCTFSVTVTIAPPQVARFTLEGEPGICSNFKVNGIYISGYALNNDNTVEVTVNVTAIGSYSINTDTLNDISFSQSGNFTATGIQKVILRGVGTPATSNIFTFTANTGTSGCTFSLTVILPGIPATYVLQSSSTRSCTGFSSTGMYNSGTPLTSTNTITVSVFVTDPGSFSISTGTVNGMIFSNQGTFAKVGAQDVLLTGSGTPGSAGTFTFTPQIIGPHPLGGETCTADIEVH